MIQSPTQTSAPVHRGTAVLIRLVGWAVLAMPIGVFAWVWFHFAVNVPKWDDHALKAFLVFVQQETTFRGKIYQVFKQHNEHRMAWDRLITWLDYSLFGKLNYVRLMALGNLSLVGLLALFGLVLRRAGRSVWYLIPVACLLFNLAQWENMFWGMAALQNFVILSWVAGSVYLLAYTRQWGAGLGLAIVATITSGNGMILWPITMAILLHQTVTQPPLTRSWRPLIGQTIGALVCIGLYFTGYEKPAVTPAAHVGFIDLLRGWLAFNGSAAEAFPFGPVIGNCVLLGGGMLILLLVLGISFLRQYPLNRPWPPIAYFFWGMAGFLLATGVVVTWSRVGFGFETLITSRYKVYSLVLLSLLFVYAAVTLPERVQRIVLGAGLLLGGALAWLSYPAYADDTYRLQQYLLTSQFNWTYAQNRPVSTIDQQTARLINNAPAPYDACLEKVFGPAADPVIVLDTLYRAGTNFMLSVNKPPSTDPDATVYIRLHTRQRTCLVATQPNLNTSRWAGLGLRPRFRPGFMAVIQQTDCPPGTYTVDVLTVTTSGVCQLHPTGQHVTISETVSRSPHTNW